MTPLPFVSDGTISEPDMSVSLKEAISRRVRPIFEGVVAKVPPEGLYDSMAIGFRPNNFRRQTSFSLNTDSGLSVDVGAIRSQFSTLARNKLVFKTYGRVVVQCGRTKLTAIWNQTVGGRKEVFRFVGSSEQVVEGIVSKKEEIKIALDAGLDQFCKDYGLGHGGVVWERAEEWIGGIDYLDKLPRDLIIHDVVFKKVYQEGVEFLTHKGGDPSVSVRHVIRNRALSDFAPLLEKELSEIRGLVAFRVDSVSELVRRVRLDGRPWAECLVDQRYSELVSFVPFKDRPLVVERLMSD